MENQLIIIDGSSMLVTAYYGNLPKALLFEKDPEKKNKNGLMLVIALFTVLLIAVLVIPFIFNYLNQ